MGKACKSIKTSLRSERAKSSYTRYLKPVAVMEHGDGKAETEVKQGTVLKFMDNEDQIMVQRRLNDELPAQCSPMRISNALPLLDEFTKTPKTPCKMQVNHLMRSPKTPCILGTRRISSSQYVLSNLSGTPKTPYAKSRFQSSPSVHNDLLNTPKTPCSRVTFCESRLESLPIDILMKVLCHLHHDQLKPAFHVSKRIREAVVLARKFHFNLTTPDRSRQALLNTMTPQPWEQWPFVKSSMSKPCPKTPKAPRHISRPPPKFEPIDACPIDDALLQESASSSALPRSICKTQLASNLALFYCDEFNC